MAETMARGFAREMVAEPPMANSEDPRLVRFVALLTGMAAPPTRTFRYCDLDGGDGNRLVPLGRTFPGATFIGICPNEALTTRASEAAAIHGLDNVRFLAAGEVTDPATELGAFDYVSMTGSTDSMTIDRVDDVAARWASALTEHGVFSIRYACTPGLTQVEPLWHLLRILARRHDGVPLDRAIAASQEISTLVDAEAAFFRTNPAAAQRFASIQQNGWTGRDARHALTPWRVLESVEVTESLQGGGLRLAAHLPIPENVLSYILPEPLLNEMAKYDHIDHPSTLVDFALNRSVRTDLFSRTAPTTPVMHPAFTQMELTRRADAPPLRERTLVDGTVINPASLVVQSITNALTSTRGTIDQLVTMLADTDASREEILRTVIILVSGGDLTPILTDTPLAAAS